MPRRNRPVRRGRPASPGPRDGADVDALELAANRGARRESGDDGEWLVREVTGASATKTYRCPGCDHEILPGRPHLVAWPAESLLGADSAARERRHWHMACWRARTRRRPTSARPRY
ncbi:MAG: hypothetical protein ACLGIA_06000 [Actinomycetes bacterium]